MRFRRHPQPTIDERDVRLELLDARRRLTGWKWTGTDPLDLDGLLRDAGYELDRRADRIDELTERLGEAERAMRSYALRETLGHVR